MSLSWIYDFKMAVTSHFANSIRTKSNKIAWIHNTKSMHKIFNPDLEIHFVCVRERVKFSRAERIHTICWLWLIDAQTELFAQRPSNRNEFIEAITIKRCILLSVYKFIAPVHLLQNIYRTQIRYWRRSLYLYKTFCYSQKQIFEMFRQRNKHERSKRFRSNIDAFMSCVLTSNENSTICWGKKGSRLLSANKLFFYFNWRFIFVPTEKHHFEPMIKMRAKVTDQIHE